MKKGRLMQTGQCTMNILIFVPFLSVMPKFFALLWESHPTPPFPSCNTLMSVPSAPSLPRCHNSSPIHLHPARSSSCQTEVLVFQPDKRHRAAIISFALIRELSLRGGVAIPRHKLTNPWCRKWPDDHCGFTNGSGRVVFLCFRCGSLQ